MEKTPIERAVEVAGGQSAMARLLSNPERGIKQGHVWAWINRDRKVPAEFVLEIEAATGITRYDLRPDVFGPPPANDEPTPEVHPPRRRRTAVEGEAAATDGDSVSALKEARNAA